MSDQGTSGVDGGYMGHSRAKSDSDAVPTSDPAVDSRTTQAPSAKEETECAQPQQPLQQQPRRFEGPPNANPQSRNSPTVSRASSSSSVRSPSTPMSAPHRHHSSPASSTTQAPATTRPLEPPVTKATLSELDVTKIIHNIKLRHDINFDPELHFRPNLDGDKGRRKQEKAGQFWSTLRDQLEQFVVDRDGFIQQYGRDEDWCLPMLLKAVKEIIQTLVPSRDRDFLDEGLNVELLMQQFSRGIADLEKLASWLSSVLKLHCAPMRDEWVDEMYQELSNGNRNNNIDELVKGMRSLLSVLEAMKLDVANHQIRCLRPMLIEDTVHFEQRFFLKKIQSRRMEILTARDWYQSAVRDYSALCNDPRQSRGDTDSFFYGLSGLVLPSTQTSGVPSTFLFDEERIIKLRSDAIDAICLDICMRHYEDLEGLSQSTQHLKPSFFSSSSPSVHLGHLAPTSVPAYVMDEDAVFASRRSSGEFNFNAPPSRPSSLSLSIGGIGSATSSPRSSGLFSAAATASLADPADARAKAARLRASLVALLQTAAPTSRPTQRWQTLAPAIAVQILRFTDAPLDMLGHFEATLTRQLTEFGHDKFREAQDAFRARLFAELTKRVSEYKNLSGLGLFSSATGSRLHSPTRVPDGGPQFFQLDRTAHDQAFRDLRADHNVDDMATRLAHLGLLHWRVWSQLAYTTADTADGSDSPAS